MEDAKAKGSRNIKKPADPSLAVRMGKARDGSFRMSGTENKMTCGDLIKNRNIALSEVS